MASGGVIIYDSNIEDPKFYKVKVYLNGKWHTAAPQVYGEVVKKSEDLFYKGWIKAGSAMTPMINLIAQPNDIFYTNFNNDFLVRKEK